MKLAFFASAALVATGTVSAATWLRQTSLATPESIMVAVWGLGLIGLSGGLRSALRKSRTSVDRPAPQTLASAEHSATRAA